MELANLFPVSAGLETKSHDQLDELEHTLQKMEDEFRDLARDLKSQSVKSERIYLCLDFDVIYSTLKGRYHRGANFFWSTVCLDTSGLEILLLPGTVSELSHYLSNEFSDYFSRQSDISFAIAEAINKSSMSKSVVDSSFREFFDRFKGVSFEDGAHFALRLLRDRVTEYKKTWPLMVDPELYYKAIYELSRGSRVERVTNNRIDAYNFALVEALNKQGAAKSERFVFVTNSPALLNFAEHRTPHRHGSAANLHRTNVWSARYAGIRQLLGMATDSTMGASRFAWAIVERMVTFRSWISKRLASELDEFQVVEQVEVSADRPDDLFIDLVSSIDELQNHVQGIAERATLWGERIAEYREMDPAGLNEKLRESLSAVRNSEALDRLAFASKATELGNTQLKAGTTKRISTNGMVEGQIRTKRGVDVVQCYGNGQFTGFYCRSVSSLEEFAGVWNSVYQLVVADHTAGKVKGDPHERSEIILGLESRDEFVEISMDKLNRYTVDFVEISNLAECHPGDIRFMRIDTGLFSASFEKQNGKEFSAFAAVASHLELDEQLSIFLRELNQPSFRHLDVIEYSKSMKTFRRLASQVMQNDGAR